MLRRRLPKRAPATCARDVRSAGPKTLDLLAGSIRFSDGATQIGWNVTNTFYSNWPIKISLRECQVCHSRNRFPCKSLAISKSSDVMSENNFLTCLWNDLLPNQERFRWISPRCFDFALQGLSRSLQLCPNCRQIHQTNVVSSRTKLYFKGKWIGNF